MSNTNPFPKPPAPQLTREDVVGYLAECQTNGWVVYEEDPNEPTFPTEERDRFTIRLHEHLWIRVHWGAGKCTIRAHVEAVEAAFGSPQTLKGLDELIARAVSVYGPIYGVPQWPSKPNTVRLAQARPATNFVTLAGLIGSSAIEAIFDPYFNDQALANVQILFNLGVKVSRNGRILTAPKGAAKLSAAYKSNWLAETGTACEFRKLAVDGAHRRFMLLSGGQSLILGMSLNSIAKDEAAHIEADSADLLFFNSQWTNAIAI